MILNAKIGGFVGKICDLQPIVDGGIHTLDVACNTEIHALDMAQGVIRRPV